MSEPTPATRLPLAPLQHGMLFHALAAPGSGVDVEQMVCTLRASVQAPLLRAAWEQVVARHTILRTAFCWEDEPVQVVHPEVALPWSEEDWSTYPEHERFQRLDDLLRADRQRGFAMDAAPLLRLTLLRFGAADHRLVWTFHHALLDGRSFPIVLREVFALYEAALASRTLALSTPRPYSDYLAWRAAQDFGNSEAYWRERLRGIFAPTPLTVDDLPGDAAQPTQGDREVHLASTLTAQLQALAAKVGVTLNTVVQGAWALLLHRYSREEDVVFGVTRACRHQTVEGADDMVGLFINTLPMRVAVSPELTLPGFLQAVRAQWVEMRPHEHTPLASVQAVSEIPGGHALFDSIVVFENYELNEALREAGRCLGADDFRLYEQTNFPLTLAAYAGARLRLRLEYDQQRFAAATIERLLGHLEVILDAFARQPELSLGQVPMLTAAELTQLTVDWNPRTEESPPGETLHELFCQQVARTPDAVAVVCDGESLTYRELDARASAWAQHLQALGVGPEVIVGLCLERSNALIVGLLAILKAGGAYLPLDLAYPPERIAFMLGDARAPVLLTDRRTAATLPPIDARIVCLDEPCVPPPGAATPLRDTAASLAYVIYTSGSTGQPKGCCITHANVVRLFQTTDEWFQSSARDVWTMFHSVAFDFSVWEIWGALLYGGRLVVVPHRVSRSPDAFLELLHREKVTVLNQTPSAFRQLIAAEETTAPLSSLRLVIFGGEALEMQSLRPWFARHGDTSPQLVNMYGITETTVHVTYRPLGARDLQSGSVIGIPLPDLQLYILDSERRPVPIGVPGEMYVGGAGVARGYLHRPELSAERFLDNPFIPGARLYRTGDLARWLPGRDIEYLGRIDQQVKIRGFRIELGEIESALNAHPAIRECAVIPRSDGPGEKRLVAYVVPCVALPLASELRAQLQTRLPDYMIPSAFVALERLPLTNNGKLDRRALPAPEPTRPELESSFVAPRSAFEERLAAIWRKVLRLNAVGVHDNFFELGGDSILSILIVSQARKAGFSLTPKHLFDHPTVAQLALLVSAAHSTVTTSAPEDQAFGEVLPTPVQRWFFAHHFAAPEHWNQSFHFRAKSRLEASSLKRAVSAVIAAHAVFRMRVQDARLVIEREVEGDAFTSVQVQNAAELAPLAAAAQASLCLDRGPLLRVVLYDLGPEEPARVLIVAHHLAMDGVSWRILLEDLAAAYEAAVSGQPIALQSPGTSFRRWSELLVAASANPALQEELPHWRDLADAPATPLPQDHDLGENTEASARTVVVRLERGETEALLQSLPAAFGTQINDVLLTALAQTFAAWTHAPSLVLELEGHGREEALVAELSGAPAADLAHTIGWFTSIYPISLPLREARIDAIQRALQRTPRRGLGYGLLRYLAGAAIGTRAEVLFNYLGQFEHALGDSSLLALTDEATGPWHSPAAQRTHLLEINCLVLGGCLEARWTYSTHRHSAATVEKLAQDFASALRGLIASQPVRANVLPLSPMQQLFFSLEAAQPNAGFDQWHATLRGPLDVAAFQEAWNALFMRHQILRTTFESVNGAVQQRVTGRVAPDFIVEDWREKSPAAQHAAFAERLAVDQQQGFSLACAPLTRITLLRTKDDTWRLIWSHHHLQIDGWSWPLLFREVSALYARKPLPATRPYEDFLHWLQQHPAGASESFWREYLRGFRTPTLLPGRSIQAAAPAAVHECTRSLPEPETTDLQDFARRQRVTLNTVLQAAWSVLLGRSSACSDVVFGASFSGRPTDLPGVETIAGPFVQNLPVRASFDPAEPVSRLLERLHAQMAALVENQFVPISTIQEWSEVPWHARLFESLLVFQNYLVDDAGTKLGDDVEMQDLVAPVRTAFPLTIVAMPGRTFTLTAIAAAQHFQAATVKNLLGSLEAVLAAIVRHPDCRIGDLPVPRIEAVMSPRQVQTASYVAPQTPLEHAIAGVWQEAFPGARVGVQNNFFDLGGHSLLMLRLHARLREKLNLDMPIVRMFQFPTIQALARHLEGSGAADDTRQAAAQSRAQKQKNALAARERLISRRS